ncbi:MAG: TldD/PmbA family protein [Proteobacteria bacterium]|nr:TldD/PmbA family protein [Pseudomonadota bacterium]
MINYDTEKIIHKIANVGDFSEVYKEEIDTFIVELFNDNIEKCIQVKDTGISLRTFVKEEVFFSATNFLPEKDLIHNHIKNTEEGRGNFTFLEEKIYTDEFDFKKDKEKLISQIKGLSSMLKSEIESLLNINILYQRYRKNFQIASSEQKKTESLNVGERIFLNLTIKRGNEKASVYESQGYTFKELSEEDLEELAKICIDRAKKQLIAKDGPSGIYPVIISSSAGGTLIHEAVGHGLEADLVDKGISIYGGKLNEKVASNKITVIDSGVVKNGWGSFYCDDEGTPARETVLIEKGVLINYLYDKFYAYKHRKTSTGNGRRQSYNFKPYPRMSNTYILPGNDNVFDIIKSIDKGVYVGKMGGGQVNTLTGDFIFEIQDGYFIEGGELTYPLKNLSIIGNGPKVLNDIEAVGNDFGTAIGTCGKEGQGVPVGDGQPSIFIPAMTIGGKI